MDKNIWKELYGTRSEAFVEGVKAGIKMYAVWDSGELLVGIGRRPIKDVFKEVDEGMGGIYG